MSAPSNSPTVQRRLASRHWLWLSGGLFALLGAAYLIVASSAFFKGFVLSRVGKAIGGQVTVAEVVFRPFSYVQVRQLKAVTTGAEPLLQVEEVRLRYSLFSILGGTLKVDEASIIAPVMQIVEDADGRCNLDPWLKKETTPANRPQPGIGPSTTPRIDLKNVTLKNATVRLIRNLKGGGQEICELTGVNTTLDQLKNGQPGKLAAVSSFKMTRPTNDVLQTQSEGHIDFVLGPDLLPRSLEAKIEMNVSHAEGSLLEWAGIRSELTADITPAEVKTVSQRFWRGEQLIGEAKVTGPLNLSQREGRLKLEIAGMDRRVLNLFGAPLGLDFGPTTLSATTEVTLTQGGSVIAADTRLSADKFSVTQSGQTTPPLDLHLAGQITINTGTATATMQTFTLEGTQNQKTLLHGRLAKPMTLTWANRAPAQEDSVFELSVTNFDCAAWKPLLGDAISAGQLSLRLNLISAQGKNEIKLEGTAGIDRLATQLGPAPLKEATLAVQFNGQVSSLKKFALNDYRAQLTQQAQPVLTLSGSASYDDKTFDLQAKVEMVMARLLGSGPKTPLTSEIKWDGAAAAEGLEARQLRLILPPTPRAPTNELILAGRFDPTTPGMLKGNLTAKAETLDLTDLFEIFADEKNSGPAEAAATSPPAEQSASKGEPAPVQLPMRLTLEANLGQVYLRDIAITNCQATVKADGGKMNLDPCRLTLNGGIVSASADLDLTVAGYAYALTLHMDRVPVEPLVNSFSPETHGQFQGLFLAGAQVKGMGLTEESLRKNLAAQASFTLTNANLQLLSPKIKKIVVPIATVLGINEVAEAPVNWVEAEAELAGGNLKLNQFTIESAAFEARTHGLIPLAAALTNSPLNLPIEFSLRRSLAEQLNLLSTNTPPDATYAMLPGFVTVVGTIGNPKSELNERAFGGVLLRGSEGMGKQLGITIGRKAGGLLKSVGGLFNGGKSEVETNQAGTNRSSTNASSKLNPLNWFKKNN